jgi:peptidylprolyl isomerase
VRTPTGLEYLDFDPGQGQAVESGSRVAVEYRAWLTTGDPIDATRHGPVEFRVGAGQVLPALDEGVLGMRLGGGRRLIVPSDLAYGSRGKGAVPPFATLIYDLRVVGIR